MIGYDRLRQVGSPRRHQCVEGCGAGGEPEVLAPTFRIEPDATAIASTSVDLPVPFSPS